jgi:gamma-glutamyl phosphate reductase
LALWTVPIFRTEASGFSAVFLSQAAGVRARATAVIREKIREAAICNTAFVIVTQQIRNINPYSGIGFGFRPFQEAGRY